MTEKKEDMPPLAALIAGVPRYASPDGNMLHEDAVLAALETAPVPDLVAEALKVADRADAYEVWVDGKACNMGSTIRALIALAQSQAAKIAEKQRTYDDLYADALADAKSDAQDFESDLWIEVRKYLTELHLFWRDYAEDGITAEQAIEYIRECMDEETRRAEAAEQLAQERLQHIVASEAKVEELRHKLQAMHRRAQKVEGLSQRSANLLETIMRSIKEAVEAKAPMSMNSLFHRVRAARDHARASSGRAWIEGWHYYYKKLEAAEAEAATLRAENERLRGALNAIDALDPEGRIGDCSVNAISGLVLRMGEIARAAMEAKAAQDAPEAGGPLRRRLNEMRAAEGCPDGVPLWSWRRMKREVREAALREAAAECERHSDWIEKEKRQGVYSAEGCLRTSARNILALIPPPPPVFATEGAEERWIADTEAGVYDDEPSPAELLVAALDAWMRDECDKIEAEIGRECRDRDLPAIWHKASILRGLIGGKAEEEGEWNGPGGDASRLQP